MSESITIFDIPLIMDLICAGLESKDIRNCAICCKLWHGAFGPYRFMFVRLDRLVPARYPFLHENRHHFRGLGLCLDDLQDFDASHCTRLRTLRLDLEYTGRRNLENHSPDKALKIQSISLNTATPRPILDKAACVADIFQRNLGLRHLHIATMYGPPVRSLDRRILDAIHHHSFLATVKITMNVTCFVLTTIIHHLPQHLQELEVNVNVDTSMKRHGRCCDTQCDRFKARTEVFRLRRLILDGLVECFVDLMFVPLLQRCPNLEELALPPMDRQGARDYDFTELTQVLNSECPRLHSLSMGSIHLKSESASKRTNVLLQGFTKGFQQLTLYGAAAGCKGTLVLETIARTATANTIEVLRVCAPNLDNNHVICILKQCPQLRELRVRSGLKHYEGVDISRLVESTNEAWACQSTLQVLELEIENWDIGIEDISKKECRRRTAQAVRQLFFRLQSLPRLAILRLFWELRVKWEGSFEDVPDGQQMNLSLKSLNEGANANGSILMTKEDMVWMGLSRPLHYRLAWTGQRL
ncbi:hypothetical protein BGX34_005174 [Mortierella sp. NVP85]|nr:hypothetical protein BGX34_005174 [Mortierella sp. NVP85]